MEMYREKAWRDVQREEAQDKSFMKVGVLGRMYRRASKVTIA